MSICQVTKYDLLIYFSQCLATLALQDVWVLSKFDQNTKKKNLRFLFDWANLLKLLKQSVNADGLSLGILGNPCPAILAQTETASEAVFYGSQKL